MCSTTASPLVSERRFILSKQFSRQIPVAGVGEQCHYGFFGLFTAYLQSGVKGSTGGDTNQNALGPCQLTGGGIGLIGGDGDHLIQYPDLQNLGGKACADTLQTMLTGFAAG